MIRNSNLGQGKKNSPIDEAFPLLTFNLFNCTPLPAGHPILKEKDRQNQRPKNIKNVGQVLRQQKTKQIKFTKKNQPC